MKRVRLGARLRLRYFLLVMVAAMLVPVAVSASHTFTDVPTTNLFHDDIAWLADANVTKGCNPPANDMFCPADNVTREQMAAFMRRLATNRVVDAATAIQATTATSAADADLLDGKSSEVFQQMAGAFSCSGTSFRRYDNLTDFGSNNSLLYRIGTAGNGLFRCSLDIPHGATLTAVHFAVHDDDAVADVFCELWRTDLTTTTVGAETPMAFTSTSGQLGAAVISTTTIEVPMIDNAKYAYFAQCSIGGATPDTGLYGASVEYGGGAAVSANEAQVGAGGSSG